MSVSFISGKDRLALGSVPIAIILFHQSCRTWVCQTPVPPLISLGVSENSAASWLVYSNLKPCRITSCGCRSHLELVMYMQLTLMSVPSLVPDPGSHHHVLADRSGHWPPRPARSTAEIHWAPDHHTHSGPHWPVWFPGSRRASREALGHRHAVSILRLLRKG